MRFPRSPPRSLEGEEIEPGFRFDPVSIPWDPQHSALIKMPRRSFRHVVATGECDVGHSENNVLRYPNQALKS